MDVDTEKIQDSSRNQRGEGEKMQSNKGSVPPGLSSIVLWKERSSSIGPKEMSPDTVLKKSPFLVEKKLTDQDVRIYSKLHGNLKSYSFDIREVLQLFEDPITVETAVQKAAEISPVDSLELITELYEKRFLVEGNNNDREIFLDYVETIRAKNRNPRITKVTFMTSGQCNMACRGCYHHFINFKSRDMTGEQASQILNGLFPYLKKRGIPEVTISFLGYEPLVTFETLCGIYDQACRMGKASDIATWFILYTNAYSISEKMLDWMRQNRSNFEVVVSLDGIKEDNDRRRVDYAGRGTYDRVVENIKRIMTTGISCRIITVLSKLNLSNVEKFVKAMADLGIKAISANIYCGQSEEERRIELTQDEKFEALTRMDLAGERYGVYFEGEWKYAVVQMVTGAFFSCPAGTKQLAFSADGVVYPCQRFAGTTVNFGSNDEDFWDKLLAGQCGGYNSWTAELYDSVAERTKDGKPDLTGWNCPFVPFLRGECLSNNYDQVLNAKLLEYYLTRPMNRIVAETPIHF